MTSVTAFPDKATIAELSAKMIIEVGAVGFSTGEPFIFTSGWASPVYIDCRRLISFPRVRQTLVDFGVSTIYRDTRAVAITAAISLRACKARRPGVLGEDRLHTR